MAERTAREDIFSNIAEFQKLFPGSDIDVQAFVKEQRSRGEQVREQMRLANEPIKKNIFEKILPFLTAGAFAIDATGRDRATRAAAPGKAAGVFKTIRERRTGKEKAQRQKSLDAIAALEMGGRFDAQSFKALLEGSQRKAAATRSAISAGTAATTLQQKKDAPAKPEAYNESRERRGAAIKLRIKHGDTPVTKWPLADQDTWTWATKTEIESPETTAEKLKIGIRQEIIKAHKKDLDAAYEAQDSDRVNQIMEQIGVEVENEIAARYGEDEEKKFLRQLVEWYRTQQEGGAAGLGQGTDPTDFEPAAEFNPPSLEELFQGAESRRQTTRQRMQPIRGADLRNILPLLSQPSESTRR